MLHRVAGVGVVRQDVEAHVLEDLLVLTVLLLLLLVFLLVATHSLHHPGPQLPPLGAGILDTRIISEKPRSFPETSKKYYILTAAFFTYLLTLWATSILLLLADLLLLGFEESLFNDSTLEAALRFILFTYINFSS